MNRKLLIGLAVVAIVVVVAVFALRRTSSATDSGAFHLPIDGEAIANPGQVAYAPDGWPDPRPQTREEALQQCQADARCSAVMFVSQEQQARRLGKADAGYCKQSPLPAECVASAYPLQLLGGATQVLYRAAQDPRLGPTLHVKRAYSFAQAQ